jgi:hypothetical protein
MGNTNYKPPKNPYTNSAPHVPVKPFIDGKSIETITPNTPEGEKWHLESNVNLVQQKVYAIGLTCSSRLNQEERDRIQKEFDRLAKGKVISKRKVLEYFRCKELQETYLSNEIFTALEQSSMSGNQIDIEKFMNFSAIFAKGTPDEKL